ncbi:DNA internalization-related competence protein ComEC/Rec2 [Solihabitans fulvus]|uniref:DNA internalization-related competence protein ComEC/Rec2 n=1 Tax=Solihabitans fulvus TaxID=1892852 RepID=A0A5B2XTG2_9PSEU|nr:DNA internalization-related competence protein ComEC/Rec2 [Solihabitans fulvus]KAA2266121.1 DNA internalization-related competence protein ComEC/Rec2 [Solihabitans fulvus]
MSGAYRLVPSALAVWAVALTGLYWGWPAAVFGGVVACCVGGLAWWRGWWCRAAVVALLVCASAASGWIGLRLHSSATHPLREAAERATPTTMSVEVSAHPRGLVSVGFGGRQAQINQVLIEADLRWAKVGTEVVEQGGDVLLMAPAQRWNDLLPGQSLQATGVLAPARPGELTVAVLRVRGPPEGLEPASMWQRGAESLRQGLRRSCAVLDAEPAGLLPGLVVGDTSALPQRVTEEFRVAGLSHLTAVSGANVAIVCGAALLLLRALRLGPRVRGGGALVVLVGFVILTGPDPSVLRAAVMGAVGLLALVLGRERSGLPALATTVIGLLLYDPSLGKHAGFALSVLATGALVALAPRWVARLRKRGLPEGIAEALAVPVAASLVTEPVLAGLSGQVSLVTVAANMLAEPAVAPATLLGVLATVLTPLHQGVGEFLVRLAGPETSWLITVGRWASAVPGATIGWPGGWGGGLLLAGTLAGAVVLLRLRRFRVLLAAVLIGVLVVLVPVGAVSPGWPAAGWGVVSCDVGQGDAAVLATAEPDRAVLVDTGPDPAPIAECLRRLGVGTIPLVILSHLHADHIGGLGAVLAEHAVGAVAVGPLKQPSWAWEEVARQTRAAGVPLVELEAGDRLDWPGLAVEVLGPHRLGQWASSGDPGSLINDASLVLRATTSVGRVLLTGDVEFAGQAALLADRADLSADVLKVPHHGSRYSLPKFLAAVRPRVALISVGAGNRYGHPNQPVIDLLAGQGALVLRTDQAGDTAVLTGARVVRRGDPRGPPRH